jgi:hypothetical protein
LWERQQTRMGGDFRRFGGDLDPETFHLLIVWLEETILYMGILL